MKTLFCLALLVLTLSASAQVSVQITNTPATSFEAFAATKDAVIIKGIARIGALEGQISYPLDVRVEELTNLQNSNRAFGVVLRTRLPNQTVINYIDYEEMDALLAGIHSIVQSDHNVTPLENFSAYFQTRGGFTVSKYSTDNRNFTALRTGLAEAEPNIMDLPAISQFETLMVAAKTKLDALRR